jgi:hypothetical protein
MTAGTFYTDPSGRGHEVTVIERGRKMTLVQYFDNERRGDRWKAGRRYSHATRVRVWVYNHELKEGRS